MKELLDAKGRPIAPTVKGAKIARIEHKLGPAKTEIWHLVELDGDAGFQFATYEDLRLVPRGPAVDLQGAGELAMAFAAGTLTMPPAALLQGFATALCAIHAMAGAGGDDPGEPAAVELGEKAA